MKASSQQAARVIAKFGGTTRMSWAMREAGYRRCPSVLRRWRLARPVGTGGRIPHTAMDEVLAAARHYGIILTPEDLAP